MGLLSLISLLLLMALAAIVVLPVAVLVLLVQTRRTVQRLESEIEALRRNHTGVSRSPPVSPGSGGLNAPPAVPPSAGRKSDAAPVTVNPPATMLPVATVLEPFVAPFTPPQPAASAGLQSGTMRTFTEIKPAPILAAEDRAQGSKVSSGVRSGSARPTGIEAIFSPRTAIWIGAIAIALGGIFLVKYSFDKRWLSPLIRVSAGAVFGITLVGLGVYWRRASLLVAQGLVSAGIAFVYAALMAAADIYHLLPSDPALLLLMVWTALAVGLSLWLGPMIALLGLVGGFITPLLLRYPHHPQSGGFFLYLFLLEAGLLAVTKRRQWLALATLAVVPAYGWVLFWLFTVGSRGADATILGLFVLGTTALLVVAGLLGGLSAAAQAGGAATQRASVLGWKVLPVLGIILGLLTYTQLLRVGGFSNTQWAMMGILAAGAMVVGRFSPALDKLAWVAVGMVLAMLALSALNQSMSLAALNVWLVALGVLLAGGSYACLWGAERPEQWAWLSVLAASVCAVLAMVAEALAYKHFQDRAAWAAVSLILAVVYTGGTWPVLKWRAKIARAESTLGALLIGVAGFFSLAAGIYFRDAILTLVLAWELPVLAWLAVRLRVPAMSVVIRILAGIVLVRLVLNPEVLNYDIGGAILFNALSLGYGGALAALLLTRWYAGRAGLEAILVQLEFSALAVALVGVNLLVRHGFHRHMLGNFRPSLLELGLYAWIGLLLALLVKVLADNAKRQALATAALLLGLLTVAYELIVPSGWFNPLWSEGVVRGPLGSATLVPTYLLPAVLAAALAWLCRRAGNRAEATALSLGAGLVAFIWLNLTLRAIFHGSHLSRGSISNAELYTYSLVWIILSIGLAVGGMVWQRSWPRIASAVIMVLAVGKVFLVDTAHLQNLLRVLSLVGLGLSLILLGYLYQRFVFRGHPPQVRK